MQLYGNECNTNNPTVISTLAGQEEDSIASQCYNFGETRNLSFSPNRITKPAHCSDNSYWRYVAETPGQTLPPGLQLGVDSINKVVRWGSIAHGQ